MKLSRIKVMNLNYLYADTGRLIKASHADPKPWAVYGAGRIRKHRTHAKALRHACKLAKKRGKK